MYGGKVKSRDLLNGTIPPPPAAEELYRALEIKTSSGTRTTNYRFDHDDTGNGARTTNYRFDRDETSSHSTTDSQPMSFNRAAVRSMAKGSPVIMRGGSDYDPQLTPPPEINERSLVLNRQEQLKARALFNFTGEQEGDLVFHKGDIISIIKKTDTQNDWWTGKLNNRQGIVSVVLE